MSREGVPSELLYLSFLYKLQESSMTFKASNALELVHPVFGFGDVAAGLTC